MIVATKADKLSNNQLSLQLRAFEKDLPESRILPYSSQTGKGRDAVWLEIEAALKKS